MLKTARLQLENCGNLLEILLNRLVKISQLTDIFLTAYMAAE